ncbi:MAG: winged helix-turn-helix domain-containing protein, partial [Dysgonamonadaceae bacterium]|nr:winged helix-turn-helix domain-containing protein [Dysgonamonadaceae bacterium]
NVIENAMYQYIDNDHVKNQNGGLNDPVNANPDPVNDPVNSFDVLELLKINPHITYDELVEKTGRSRATIKRMIKRLKQERYISRAGSDKTGYWKINQ